MMEDSDFILFVRDISITLGRLANAQDKYVKIAEAALELHRSAVAPAVAPIEAMSTENSCLTCRFMDDPEFSHKWHRCTWKTFGKLPACAIDPRFESIYILKPYTDCPTWEPR